MYRGPSPANGKLPDFLAGSPDRPRGLKLRKDICDEKAQKSRWFFELLRDWVDYLFGGKKIEHAFLYVEILIFFKKIC